MFHHLKNTKVVQSTPEQRLFTQKARVVSAHYSSLKFVRTVLYPMHPGGSEVHYKGKYVCTTDGWCKMWSDAPDGRSLQSFLTNVIPTLSGTRPQATFDKFELITHIVQNGLGAVYH